MNHEEQRILAQTAANEVLRKRNIRGYIQLISTGWSDEANFTPISIVYETEKDKFIIGLYSPVELLNEAKVAIKKATQC